MKFCLLFALSLTLVLGKKIRSFDKDEVVPRIVNGYQNKRGEVPYIVWLVFNLSDIPKRGCGGSIIDHEWILTAAHCVANASSVTISYGATWRNRPQRTLTVDKSHFYGHENYDPNTNANDIALIKTPYVNFTNLIDKIDLPTEPEYRHNSFVGCRAIASGWGNTWHESPIPNTLLSIEVTVIQNEVCSALFDDVIDSTLCTATFAEWKSTCKGDSGGPLVLRKGDTKDGKPRLIGVVSFVGPFCHPDLPNGYARVTEFLDWIKKTSNVGT